MMLFSRSDVSSDERKTRIVDGPAAKAWLARMAQPASTENLDEIRQVLETLGAQGAQDRVAALTPERKFAIADRIRGVVLPLLGDRASEDRFSVLPLPDDFSRHFWAAVNAATALRDVYAWLVSQLPEVPSRPEPVIGDEKGGAVDAGPAAHHFVTRVGALHRALDVNAYVMLCVQRARWAVPAVLWERHCVLGQLVRDLDCQDIEITDALRVSATKTCRAAFVLPVMIALADPSVRSGVEFEMIRMAAQRWSAKVGFRLERRSDVGAAPARPVAHPGPTVTLGAFVLRFDTQSALHSIDKRLAALAEGRSPRDAGIGDSLRPQVARDLLLVLKQRWGSRITADIDSPDRTWRPTAASAQLQAVVGLPTDDARLQTPVAGTADGHGAAGVYSYHRDQARSITRQPEQVDRLRIERLLGDAETWKLVAEAADAIHCVRKHPRPRIGLHRLVGLRLGTAVHPASVPESPFMIGWVEGLQGHTVLTDDRQLQPAAAHSVRVRLAPGLPQWLRASIDDVDLDCAFLMVPGDIALQAGGVRAPAFVPMLTDVGVGANHLDEGDGWDVVRSAPRSYGLVLPQTSFRPQRLVKAVRRGALAMLRLEELMMRGSDFDLVRFTVL
jgi:hypothetical protein